MSGSNQSSKIYGTGLVLVGACAIDTILTVPYFPSEDSKLRAVSSTRRRGGNCPNTLEVLHQLIQLEGAKVISKGTAETGTENPFHTIDSLALISTLPSKRSPIMSFIYNSFNLTGKETMIDFSRCIHREDQVDPISSYIISSQSTGSRTIVNHNALPEMTFEEFQRTIETLVIPRDNLTTPMWFHFEGRIPPTTLQCMKHLRRTWRGRDDSAGLTISVELEKPGREGLQDLALQADIVFYSRSWAEGEGYASAPDCLLEQAAILKSDSGSGYQENRILICTWDKSGASGLIMRNNEASSISDIVHSPACSIDEKDLIDTVGAGDTFIAGILFALINRRSQWSLERKLDFANALAGRKIIQHGFSGIAEHFAGDLRSSSEID